MQTSPLTLFDKLWQRHLVDANEDGEALLYVDRHLVYEVTRLDDIALTLQRADRIRAFEAQRRSVEPWLFT